MPTEVRPRQYQRPADEPNYGNHVIQEGSGGPLRLRVDGRVIPYIGVVRQEPEQMREEYGLDRVEAAEWADPDIHRQARRLVQAIEEGEPCYCLHLDDRFKSRPIPESEINGWAWFLAHAMAVSAGYTSHGEGSRAINRHGPSRV